MINSDEIKLNLTDEFFGWINAKGYSQGHLDKLKSCFNQHWKDKSFNEPFEMDKYIKSRDYSKITLIKTIRTYLNFYEMFNKLSSELVNKYKRVLKLKHRKTDFYVPTNEEVKKNYDLIKDDETLELIFLILATSGIRVIECIDLLKNFDNSKFKIEDNFAYYTVSKTRNTKNINNIYLPLFTYQKLFKADLSYNAVRKRFRDRKCVPLV